LHRGTISSSFIKVSWYGVLTLRSPDRLSPKSAVAALSVAGLQKGSANQGYVSALFATGPTWLAVWVEGWEESRHGRPGSLAGEGVDVIVGRKAQWGACSVGSRSERRELLAPWCARL
jgi:hypothetical protein